MSYQKQVQPNYNGFHEQMYFQLLEIISLGSEMGNSACQKQYMNCPNYFLFHNEEVILSYCCVRAESAWFLSFSSQKSRDFRNFRGKTNKQTNQPTFSNLNIFESCSK